MSRYMHKWRLLRRNGVYSSTPSDRMQNNTQQCINSQKNCSAKAIH